MLAHRSLLGVALSAFCASTLLVACEPSGIRGDDDAGPAQAVCDEAVPMDLDGDGIPDAFDTNCDGIADAIDTDGDGIPDAFDTTGDGKIDDWDGDGIPDPLPPGVDNGDLANENSDGDGYCFTAEAGWFECDDGAPPGSGVPGTPELGDPGLGVPPPGDPVCDEAVFAVDEAPAPRILLVVDKSGSMGDDAVGYPGSKWSSAVSALSAVVTSLSSDVDFGLMLFPDGSANTNVCREGRLSVNVSSDSAASIVSRLNNASPGGGTPTASTLDEARSVLNGLSDDGGSRVVVLATDGAPGCNGSLNANNCRCGHSGQCTNALNCLDEHDTVAAASALTAAGYSMFVIGIPGSENFTDVLNDLAEAGGTALPGATKFYRADDADALATSLESIASRVAACRFDLDAPVSAADVTVTVGPITVPHDTSRTNGWDLVDSDTIELFGASCDALLGAPASVRVGYCYDPGALGG